jgi:nucleotide-binding universal stress UspA family protein
MELCVINGSISKALETGYKIHEAFNHTRRKNMPNEVTAAIDGSSNSYKSLDYLGKLFGSSSLSIRLIYILPALPPLFDDPAIRRKAKEQLKAIEGRNREVGETILSDAIKQLQSKGIAAERIQKQLRPKEIGPARDICNLAEKSESVAIVVGARGRSRLERFFSGSVSNNIIQCSGTPVWLVNEDVKTDKVLLAVDSSENAMNAVAYAAYLLAETAAEIALFHTKRDLSRFIPKEVLEAAPDLEELWQSEAGERIAPFMKKAGEVLRSANIVENRISMHVIPGTRSPAGDILAFARENGFGTIVMGRHGESDKKDYAMGSITGKVVQDAANLAIWIC